MVQGVLVVVTVEGLDAAESIARNLLQRRLVAGVNLIGPVRTIYLDEGKDITCEETILMMRSLNRSRQEICDVMSSIAPDLEVAFFEGSWADGAFSDWIDQEVESA